MLSLVFTAFSQVASMGLGVVLALAIVLRFGKSADTDAIFAAYGVYGTLLILCLSLRTTVVSRLTESSNLSSAFDRLLGAGLVMLLVCAVLLVGLGGPLAAMVAGALGQAAQALARSALAILSVAVAGQLVAALTAAALGSIGEFGISSIAYGTGALSAIAVLLLTAPWLGILAVPCGVAAGSLLAAGLMLARLVALGYRPGLLGLLAGAGEIRTLVLMLAGSVLPVVVQVNYVIALSRAGLVGVGAITLFTYAFSASALVVGVTAGPCAFVLAGPLARTWDRRPTSLGPYLRTVFRLGLVLILPLFALAVLIGAPVIEVVFGRVLRDTDVDAILMTFAALSGAAVATLALQIPLLAAYTLSRHSAVALLSLAAVFAQVVLAKLASDSQSLPLLGVATSASTVVLLIMVLSLVYGRGAGAVFLYLLGDSLRVLAICMVTFGPAWLAERMLSDTVWDFVLAAGAVILFAVLLRALLPTYVELVVSTGRSLLGVQCVHSRTPMLG